MRVLRAMWIGAFMVNAVACEGSAISDHDVRKQVYDLTPADLQRHPIWEFAIDEEGMPGQDEATVRPRPDLEIADADDGSLVVRCSFLARDGTQFTGYCTPSVQQDPGSVQPTIVTDDGQVNFWLGALDTPPSDLLSNNYALLDKSASDLFPLTYASDVQTAGNDLHGRIEGFMWMTFSSDEIHVTR